MAVEQWQRAKERKHLVMDPCERNGHPLRLIRSIYARRKNYNKKIVFLLFLNIILGSVSTSSNLNA